MSCCPRFVPIYKFESGPQGPQGPEGPQGAAGNPLVGDGFSAIKNTLQILQPESSPQTLEFSGVNPPQYADSNYDPSSSVYTVPADGKYLVGYNLVIFRDVMAIIISVTVNDIDIQGTIRYLVYTKAKPTSPDVILTVSLPVVLKAGDRVSMRAVTFRGFTMVNFISTFWITRLT